MNQFTMRQYRIVDILDSGKYACVDGPFGSNLKSEHYRSSGIPVIQSGFVTSQRFVAGDYVFVDQQLFEEQKRSRVVGGEIVMAKIGARAGSCALLPHDHPESILAGNCLKIRPNEHICLSAYLVHLLHFHYARDGLSEIRTETAQPAISIASLKAFRVQLPPLPVQKLISTILSTWDTAIELTEKLIAAKWNRKTALMQQLLTGKARLPGFGKHHWKTCQLGDVASNSARRNGTTTAPEVYSVTNSVGMVPMSEDIVGESIDRYKTVGKHDFAYNPMRINVGSIAMWKGDEEVLVSPDYVVFQCGPELDAEFLNHFRKTHYWDQFVNKSGGGSVRVRIYFSDLAELALKLPPLEEQKAIAAVLNTQDREIELLQQKLDALRRQKKGLMQQLLTGKVWVKP